MWKSHCPGIACWFSHSVLLAACYIAYGLLVLTVCMACWFSLRKDYMFSLMACWLHLHGCACVYGSTYFCCSMQKYWHMSAEWSYLRLHAHSAYSFVNPWSVSTGESSRGFVWCLPTRSHRVETKCYMKTPYASSQSSR